jgi:hypothetical protein
VNTLSGYILTKFLSQEVNPLKILTGERAMLKKDIQPILEEMKSSKFGVKTLINLYFQAHEKRVKYVMLEGLKHPTKFDKTGSQSKAVKEFFLEGHQIALAAFNSFNLLTTILKIKSKNYRI